MHATANIKIQGFVKILDLCTGEVLRDVENAVNPETMSLVIANMLQGNNGQYLYELHLGDGGSIADDPGNITYKDVEENLTLGKVAELYNPLFFKVIDTNDDVNNTSPTRNNVIVNHLDGLPYTDIVITCTLEEEDPISTDPERPDGVLVFNELGLKSRGSKGVNSGFLLSHVVFEPVTKTVNRVIQIEYTLRIRA